MSRTPEYPAEQPTTSYPGEPVTPDAPAARPPNQIGRFEIRAVLGQGSFGVVFRAYDPQLDREVALKVPRLPRDRPDLVERFLREARVAARLRHPGIVAVFEAGQAGRLYFIASEFVTGSTLRQTTDKERPTLRQAAAWVRDLALALEYAHGQGVIHRDVKPGNIMIDTKNRPQLTDFGLAKRFDTGGPVPVVGDSTEFESGPGQIGGGALLTTDGAVLGTPAYMSPEQAGGVTDAVGPHSDQYSLGVVLYELLTGRPPFQGSVQEVLRQAADPDRAVPSPRAANPEVPAPLAAVCLKAVAKVPSRRYSSAAEMAVDLQRWLNGQPVLARRESRRPAKKASGVTRWWLRNGSLVWKSLVGLALIGVLVGGATWLVASLRRQAEDSRQEAVAARRATDLTRCDLYLERGRGKDDKGLRWLAEAGALALEMADTRRYQAAAAALAEEDRPLPRPPGADGEAGLRWDLAAHLLLGRPLPRVGAWESLGERAEHAGNARYTAFAGDPPRLLTADRPADQRSALPFRDARTGEAFGQPVPGSGDAYLLPGGRRVLRVGVTWTVFDPQSGQALGPKHERDWRLPLWGVSPDGTKLVVFHRPTLTVQVWDVQTMRALTRQVRVPDPLLDDMALRRSSAAVNNDGSRVAVVAAMHAFLWSVTEAERTGTDGPTAAKPGRSLGPEPEGGWRKVTDLHLEGICALAFHPDGRRLLVAGQNGVGLTEWPGERVDDLLPAEGVQELVVSPRGDQVLTRRGDGWQLWDVTTRRQTGLPLERPGKFGTVAFRGDGRQLLTADDGDARLWPNPVVADADRPAALRLWALAASGLEIDADGGLRPLDPAEREQCGRRFARLAGLEP
jgi:serine/threonine protein kinase